VSHAAQLYLVHRSAGVIFLHVAFVTRFVGLIRFFLAKGILPLAGCSDGIDSSRGGGVQGGNSSHQLQVSRGSHSHREWGQAADRECQM